MTLSSQKYANTFRTISGLVNVVYDNDVVLLCDTSAGAVALDLAQIPADNWNTVYKLYVVDNSGNAGTNNITIKAPLGYTINNASTFVINVNKGVAIVRISSNTSYVGETNYGYPSGLAVQNEGVPITPSATTMNFVGAGVNATAVGGFVTIDIAGTAVVPVSSAQLLTLISTNAIVPNTWYLISNANFTLSVPETVPILVQGVTVNSVSLTGSGIFLNADYQQVGNYSGVTGFVSNLGVWQTTLVPVIGSVVIWNNLHYVNTTGVNGATSPNIDVVNWTVLVKNSTNGYIQEIDDITYQSSSNNIISRSDVRNNHIQNNPQSYPTTDEAFLMFQWGNNQVSSNTVTDESVFVCWNNYVIGTPALGHLPSVLGNKVSGSSQLVLQTNSGDFQNNTVSQNVTANITNQGTFSRNDVSQFGAFILENGNGSKFTDNTISKLFTCDIHNLAGKAQFVGNTIEDSVVNITQNTEDFISNRIIHCEFFINTSNNAITSNQFNSAVFSLTTLNTGTIVGNIVNGGTLSVAQNDGQISTNVIGGSSALRVLSINTNGISNNIISQGSFLNITTNNGIIANNDVTQESSAIIIANSGAGSIQFNSILNNSTFSVQQNNLNVLENYFVNSTFQVQTVNDGIIQKNSVLGSSILRVATNTPLGTILNNEVSQESEIVITLNDGNVGEGGRFYGNRISQNATLTLGTVDGGVSLGSNAINLSKFSITFVGALVGLNNISKSSVDIGNCLSDFSNIKTIEAVYQTANHNVSVQGGVFMSGLATIPCEIDMSDPTIYNPATFTLTIPSLTVQYLFGYLTLMNGGGQTIKKIIGLNDLAPTTFFSGTGTVSFDSVAVGGAVANEIVSNSGAGTFNIVYRVNAPDLIVLYKSVSNLNKVSQANIFI